MFRYIAESLVFWLIKYKKVDIEDRDIYIYGLEVILLNGLLLIFFELMSICFNMTIHFYGFLIFFIPLRMFAGGYHAKYSETCFILSNIMYLITLIIVKNYMYLYRYTGSTIAMLIALIIICAWSPIKNSNRPLAEYQYKRNRRITFGICTVEFVLFILFSRFDFKITSSAVIFVLLNCVVFLIGKMKNEFYRSKG